MNVIERLEYEFAHSEAQIQYASLCFMWVHVWSVSDRLISIMVCVFAAGVVDFEKVALGLPLSTFGQLTYIYKYIYREKSW